MKILRTDLQRSQLLLYKTTEEEKYYLQAPWSGWTQKTDRHMINLENVRLNNLYTLYKLPDHIEIIVYEEKHNIKLFSNLCL